VTARARPKSATFGLDVAVHETCAVRDSERVEHAVDQVERRADRQGALLAQVAAQVGPVDVLHREIARLTVEPLVVHTDETGVREAGRRTRLATEARDEVRAVRARRQVRVHDLEGDLAVEPTVDGEVHRGHPATRDAGHDLVPPVDQAADERIGDGCSHGPQSTVAVAPTGGRARQLKRVMWVWTFAT
jgi:hypothetical protein